MKNFNLKPLGSKLRMSALLFAVVIAGVSCQKSISSQDEATAASREVEMLTNKPGTDPIAKIAIDNGFNELVSALMYVDKELNAGLVDLFMNGKDQFTVFAPTDDAFKALYAALSTQNAVVDEITDLPAPLVLSVLQYHVTGGRRASFNVLPKNGMREITTLLSGANFWVDPMGNIKAIGNTAKITAADFNASNGIVHVIDAVILPIK